MRWCHSEMWNSWIRGDITRKSYYGWANKTEKFRNEITHLLAKTTPDSNLVEDNWGNAQEGKSFLSRCAFGWWGKEQGPSYLLSFVLGRSNRAHKKCFHNSLVRLAQMQTNVIIWPKKRGELRWTIVVVDLVVWTISSDNPNFFPSIYSVQKAFSDCWKLFWVQLFLMDIIIDFQACDKILSGEM